MKRSLSVLAIWFAACTTASTGTGESPPNLDRAELDRLGIAQVEGADGNYVLRDATGQQIGEILLSETDVHANYRDQRAVTHIDRGSWSATCNGQSVSTVDGLAQCSDALEIASMLSRTHSSQPPTHHAQNAETCIWLGINYYCDGGTEVYSFDCLCNNGEMDYVVSTTVQYPAASYCEGL